MRAKRAVAIAAAAVVLLTTSAAFAQTASIAFQPAPGAEYPEVTLEITLPAELLRDGAKPTFDVKENGQVVTVVSAEPVADGAGRAPAQVVLLIDASGSMKGQPLDNARAAAHRFIDEMGATDQIALISFSWSPIVLSGFTSDRAALGAAIDGVQASGETAVNDAVVRAAELAATAPGGRATLVLLSDGGDTVSINSLAAATAAVRDRGTPVFVVALESGEYDPQTLAGLASASGGRLLSAQDSAELSNIYAGIARELTNRYLVTFTSREPNTADLELEVTARAGEAVSTGSGVIANPRYASGGEADAGPVRRDVGRDPLVWAVVLLAAFGGSTLLGLAVFDVILPRRASLARVEFYDQTAESAEPSSRAAGVRGQMVDAVGYVAGRRGITRVIQDKLQRAGISLRPAEYMYFHLIAVIGLGLITRLLTGSLAITILMVALAAAVPLMLLEAAITRRVRAFEEQLPDVLNLLAGSLRAGWSISQAIGLVVEQMPPPASVEFQRVQTEARLGLPVEEALLNMADRLNSDDFRWTVSAIAIQRDVGGNLAEVLDIVASTMRERAELQRHIHSLTAEGRMSGGILMALPFAELLALLVVNPGYIGQLFESSLGIAMAVIGALLLLIGFVWLRRALVVEV